ALGGLSVAGGARPASSVDFSTYGWGTRRSRAESLGDDLVRDRLVADRISDTIEHMEMAVKDAKAALKEATHAGEPPEPLSANLGWLLSQASYTLGTEITAALERVGISPRAYCLLTTA